jgi:hypothetical protein
MLKPDVTRASRHMYDQQDAEWTVSPGPCSISRPKRPAGIDPVRAPQIRKAAFRGGLKDVTAGGRSLCDPRRPPRGIGVQATDRADAPDTDRLRLRGVSSRGHAGLVGGRTCRVVTIRSARIFGNRLKYAFVNGGGSSSGVALTLSRGLRRNREHAKHCRQRNQAQAQAIHSFSPSLLQGRCSHVS